MRSRSFQNENYSHELSWALVSAFGPLSPTHTPHGLELPLEEERWAPIGEMMGSVPMPLGKAGARILHQSPISSQDLRRGGTAALLATETTHPYQAFVLNCANLCYLQLSPPGRGGGGVGGMDVVGSRAQLFQKEIPLYLLLEEGRLRQPWFP